MSSSPYYTVGDEAERLRAEVERLREALHWIVRVAATEAEYKQVARQALIDVGAERRGDTP